MTTYLPENAVREYVCTYLIPYGAKPPLELITVYQESTRYQAIQDGFGQIESEGYKVVNSPDREYATLFCYCRGAV
jgi:hypothetical protein